MKKYSDLNKKKLSSNPKDFMLEKIQGLFKTLSMNLRTFQGCMEFKNFSRTPSKIQGLLKTVRTLFYGNHFTIEGHLLATFWKSELEALYQTAGRSLK